MYNVIRLLIILSNIRIIMVVLRRRKLRRRFRNMWLCIWGLRRIISWFWIRFRGGCKLLGICRNDFMRVLGILLCFMWYFVYSLLYMHMYFNLYLYLYCIYIKSSIHGKHPNNHYWATCSNPHNSFTVFSARYHNC